MGGAIAWLQAFKSESTCESNSLQEELSQMPPNVSKPDQEYPNEHVR